MQASVTSTPPTVRRAWISVFNRSAISSRPAKGDVGRLLIVVSEDRRQVAESGLRSNRDVVGIVVDLEGGGGGVDSGDQDGFILTSFGQDQDPDGRGENGELDEQR